ncbi:hypothetical protein I552_5519 [Mycobacterium xenopi 3993]|nr:hypothetical protein I552_5519 [Mycobacterium xenopi 3993]
MTRRCGSGTTGDMARVVDSDQHLYESRSLWADHIDPSARDEALSLVDDERGYTWLSWRAFPSRWLMSTFPATPRRAATTATAAGPENRPPTATTRRCRLPTGVPRLAFAGSTRSASTKPWCSPTTACCGSDASRRRGPRSPRT